MIINQFGRLYNMDTGYSTQQSSVGTSDINNIPFNKGPPNQYEHMQQSMQQSMQQPTQQSMQQSMQSTNIQSTQPTPPTLEDIQKSRNSEIESIRSQDRVVQEPHTNTSVVSQDIINKMIPDIQSANERGYLSLPDRDIPKNETQYTNDTSIQPNKQVQFSADTTDYIPRQVDNTESSSVDKKSHWSREFLYDELFTPILAGILFYIFSNDKGIEIIQKLIPSLFRSDGNMKKYGNLVISCIFSFTIYTFIKTYDYTAMVI